MRLALRFALLALIVASCMKAVPQYKVVKLKSGREVKLMGVVPMNFPDSGPALMLRYQTDVPIADATRLHEEVLQIWSVFRVDAERARVRDAIISANTPPSGGLIKNSEGFNFVFSKGPDGEWREAPRK